MSENDKNNNGVHDDFEEQMSKLNFREVKETPEPEVEDVPTPPDVEDRACRNDNEHIGHYWHNGNPDLGYYCEGRRRA